LLRVVIGNPEGFKFLGKEQITKSCRVGGETVAVADFGTLFCAVDLVDPVAGVVASVGVAGGVTIRMALASAVAAATSSSAAVVVGTVATAAPFATTTAPTAVAPMQGSSRKSSRAVGCLLVFTTDAVASAVYWDAAATSGFVVSSGCDSVVHSHEVGVLNKLGDDFDCVVPLGMSCYHGDRHEAFLRAGCTRLET
jgi:hypothetical protein